MVYRNYKPDAYYEGIKRAEQTLIRAMIIGIIVAIGSILLFIAFPLTFMSFFVAIGLTFGSIYFIQNYRGWLIVQNVKRKGRFDDEDKERMRRI